MRRDYRLYEDDLLEPQDFPIKAIFNLVNDRMFKPTIERLSQNKGFFVEYGACLFWDDLDDYDKEITPYYDGVEFGLHSGEELIIDCKKLLYYLLLICKEYCSEYPEDTETINRYIQSFKDRNHLE